MRGDRIEDALPPDLPLRTCSVCGWPCVTEGAAVWHFRDGVAGAIRSGLKVFGGLVAARPLCAPCMRPHKPPPDTRRAVPEEEGTGGLYAQTLRAMEDHTGE